MFITRLLILIYSAQFYKAYILYWKFCGHEAFTKKWAPFKCAYCVAYIKFLKQRASVLFKILKCRGSSSSAHKAAFVNAFGGLNHDDVRVGNKKQRMKVKFCVSYQLVKGCFCYVSLRGSAISFGNLREGEGFLCLSKCLVNAAVKLRTARIIIIFKSW
jgi:hypothetical protein